MNATVRCIHSILDTISECDAGLATWRSVDADGSSVDFVSKNIEGGFSGCSSISLVTWHGGSLNLGSSRLLLLFFFIFVSSPGSGRSLLLLGLTT